VDARPGRRHALPSPDQRPLSTISPDKSAAMKVLGLVLHLIAASADYWARDHQPPLDCNPFRFLSVRIGSLTCRGGLPKMSAK
jgi:hypothetical protein